MENSCGSARAINVDVSVSEEEVVQEWSFRGIDIYEIPSNKPVEEVLVSS
jgi:hypothetical protein